MTKTLLLRLRIPSLLGIALMLCAAALPVLAQTQQSANCSGTACLQNPLSFATITQFVQGVLQATVMIALPIITLFIVYAGFMFIMARGKDSGPHGLGAAKENFKWVIIGAALILGAWTLATLIGGTITQLLPGGGGGSAVPLR